MKQFTGRKVINAKPMTLGEYNTLRGWDIPDDEDPKTEGYVVEYTDSPIDEVNALGNMLYLSWSPKDVFERSYKPSDTYVDRLHIEYDELKAKLHCLTAFIGTPKFNELNEEAQLYQRQQHEVMTLYVDILEKRISLATGKKFPAEDTSDGD